VESIKVVEEKRSTSSLISRRIETKLNIEMFEVEDEPETKFHSMSREKIN